MPESILKASCTSARYAGSFDCLMASLILITMDNGRGHCAWWQSCTVPNQTHKENNKKRKMYAIKQIKICAEYRDMLPRPRLDLSGTPGSWQTSLGLGSMSRYSAQILICVIHMYDMCYTYISVNRVIHIIHCCFIGGTKPLPEPMLTHHQDPLSCIPLQWRHDEHDSVSNHQPRDRLLNRLFGRKSKKTSKLRVTVLCAGNSPGTGEFPAQRASNAENVSIWWRHHARVMLT